MTDVKAPLRTAKLVLPAEDPTSADRYREAFAELFDAEVDKSSFYGSFEKVDLGGAVLGRSSMVGQTFRRTRRHVQQNGVEHIQLVYYFRGDWRGDYDGQSGCSETGSLRVIDASRPLIHSSTTHSQLNLAIPRTALGPACAARNLHGLVLTEHAPIVKVLVAHLRTLWNTYENLSAVEALATARAAGVLLGAAIGTQAALDPEQRKPIERTLIAMACDYIHARLGDGALTPRAISLHLGISTRTLYRLFEPMGGVAAFIQNKRLERAHDAIVRRGRGVSLAEIGYAHGFSSASHFSRAFRAHFGFPPGEACDVEKPAHRSSSMSTFSSTIVDWCKD